MRRSAISLFSGAGIGDVGFRAAGFDVIAMCELEPKRAALAQVNFPSARVFADDLRSCQAELVKHVRSRLRGDDLHLLSCTAPCQGMSKNGKGTLLKNIRAGQRPALDPRNRLVLPALDVIRTLRPRWVVLENVLEMRHTIIEDDDGESKRLLDVVFERLGGEYVGAAYDVEFADYGVPQRRQRLITVLTRDTRAMAAFRAGASLIPPPSHGKAPTQSLAKWVSVTEAIGAFPQLDGANELAASFPSMPFHRVPVLDPKKYEWIRHTPPRRSAFDNQCVRPGCGYQKNRTHGASHDRAGINRSHRDTPLYCERCHELLPRPFTVEGDRIRLMSGYVSAYKRMDPDLPAPALTRNLSYPCSDQKLHPSQNRVLSLAEAMTIHTLDRFDFVWGPMSGVVGNMQPPDSLIRLVIGESVPPRFFELLGRHILGVGKRLRRAAPGCLRSSAR